LADDDDDDDGGDFSFHLAIPDRPHVRGLRLPKHHHMGIANGGSDGAVPYLPSVSSRRGARKSDFSSADLLTSRRQDHSACSVCSCICLFIVDFDEPG